MKTKLTYILLIFFFITSCKVKLYLPEGRDVSGQRVQKQIQFLQQQYPDSFLLTQRIILTISGKQYDFIGSLKMNADKSFHLIAVGEMGGAFLELQHKSGKTKILKNPGNLPENPLLDGVVEDINHLYNFMVFNECHSSLIDESSWSLYFKSDSEASRLYTFDSNYLVESDGLEKGKVIRRIVYSNYRKFDNVDCALPARIILENKKWRYSLKIDLLKIE